MTVEEIKAELAQRAGTDDVPEVYAEEAAAWISTLLRTVEAWADNARSASRYTNEPIR